MSMEGDARILTHLQNVAQRVPRNAARQMREAALRIQEIARRMAPRDLGNLEDAIKIAGVEGTGGRDLETGRFTRAELVVYVDENHPAEGRAAGVLVGQYAMYMHEGEYGLGLRSLEKQFSESEYEVGPKFMERAAEEVEKELMQKMIQATFALL